MKKTDRNAPCTCGSGKKYKNCCLAKAATPNAPVRRTMQSAADNFNTTNVAPPSELLLKAVALHQAGQLDQAEAAYRRLLQNNPDDSDALHYLGLIAFQQEDYAGAVRLIGQAARINGNIPAFHFNLGNAYKQLKQFDSAVDAYREALRLDSCFLRAYLNLGNTLKEQGNLEAAIESYRKALALKPDYAEAHSNLGIALQAQGKLDAAIESYRNALALKPDYAEAHSNLGTALQAQGRLDAAIESYREALALKPDYAELHNNLGNAFETQGDLDAAIRHYSKALSIKPDYPEAHANLFYAQLLSCDWTQYTRSMEKVIGNVNEGKQGCNPFSFLAMSPSPADQLRCARIYAANKYPPSKAPLWTGQRYIHDKIRIAYLSADFHNHATAYLMAELFEAHDKKRFETTAISFGVDAQDDMRERLRRSFDRFEDARDKSDLEAAMLLRELEIDIAVDLKGFTQYGRPGILAHRAAPIQVSYLGYPGTMGANYIDYIIADEYVIPPGQQACYTEKVVYLPDSYQVNDSRRRIAERIPTRAEANLPEKGFVFCCFNNNYKITPDIFGIWMRLLERVEDSVLWLLEGNSAASRNLRREATRCGIAPERLVFAPKMKLDEHLARHKLANLFLDTLPCNAHTTASDALWAGLPVLTCMGNAFAGRVAASLLSAVGLPDLIARSLEEYEMLALKLATMPALLGDIRNRLAQNRTGYPLFDTDQFRRHIEAAYITMWERCQRGEQPASFAASAFGCLFLTK